MLLRAKLLINTLNRWGSKSEEWRLRLPFNDIIPTLKKKKQQKNKQRNRLKKKLRPGRKLSNSNNRCNRLPIYVQISLENAPPLHLSADRGVMGNVDLSGHWVFGYLLNSPETTNRRRIIRKLHKTLPVSHRILGLWSSSSIAEKAEKVVYSTVVVDGHVHFISPSKRRPSDSPD